MAGKVTVDVTLKAPIIGSQTEDRIVAELGDGTFVIGRVKRDDHAQFTEECRFNFAELKHAAMLGFQSDPDVGKVLNKQAGKALAAGALMMMMAIGLVQSEEEK